MKEDYIIRIKSRIDQDDDRQEVELMTRGSFVARGGSYYITYNETETTGYAGCVTTIKLRRGPAHTQLVIEKGRRNLCHYETGYGSVTLGVTADEIVCNLSEKGGTAKFSYLLDADNAAMISRNSLEVTVNHVN